MPATRSIPEPPCCEPEDDLVFTPEPREELAAAFCENSNPPGVLLTVEVTRAAQLIGMELKPAEESTDPSLPSSCPKLNDAHVHTCTPLEDHLATAHPSLAMHPYSTAASPAGTAHHRVRKKQKHVRKGSRKTRVSEEETSVLQVVAVETHGTALLSPSLAEPSRAAEQPRAHFQPGSDTSAPLPSAFDAAVPRSARKASRKERRQLVAAAFLMPAAAPPAPVTLIPHTSPTHLGQLDLSCDECCLIVTFI